MNAILEQINSTGKIFVEFALPMLVQSGVLILILLLADFALRKKLRAVFRYWIWLLVLLKLLLPTSLSSPLSLGYFFGEGLAYVDIAQTTEEPHVTVVDPTPASVPPFIDLANIEAYRHTPTVPPIIPDTEPAVTEPINSPVVSVTPVTWQGAVFLVWLTVVMAMGLLLLQRAIFVRGLVAQAKEANGFMTDTLESCRRSMGVKRKLGLKVSANATSPAVCGLFRPVILVPQNLTSSLSKSQLRAVLLHELAHIRRGDLWVNLAQTFLQIIYFYNPLLWLANCVIRRVREQAVDEMVLVVMGEAARQYPQTLVNVAKMAFKRPALSLRLIGVVESKSALAGRIKHILNRPMPKRAKLGILGLAVVIITAAILLPMATCTPGPPSLVIKGTVKNAQTGEPIAGARVFDDGYGPKPNWEQIRANERSEWGAITNSAGEYSFLTWPEHHSIKVEAPGYKAERQSLYDSHFVFNKKDEEIFDFALEPEKILESSGFKTTLPNGVTVELIGVCEHPSEGKQWWRPDGTELSKEIRVRTSGRVSASGIPYTVAVKVTMPEDATFELGRIKGATGGLILEAVDSEGRPISNMRAWMVYIDEKLTATSIQLGVAAGPWKTRARDSSRGGKSTAGIVFSKAYESDGGVRIIVADEHLDLDYRITAIDTQGKEHLFHQLGGSAGRVRQTTALFHDIKLNQIEYFLFQTRPYEWVEFKNVSLRPGVITDMQIEVEKSDVLRVPSDKYPTIQSAVNAAKDGDTIVVKSDVDVYEQNKVQIILQANVFTVNTPLSSITDFLKNEFDINKTTMELTDAQAKQFKEWVTSIPGTNIATSPRTIVFDGQSTEMSITTRTEYILYEKDADSPSGYKPKREEIKTGIEIEFRPELRQDNKLINLALNITKSDIPQIKEITHESGNEVQLPAISRREISTMVAIPIGKYCLISIAGIRNMLQSEIDIQPDTTGKQTILLIKADVQVETEKPQSLIFHGLDLTAVPHTTNSSKLPDLFEQRPLGSKSYHVQKDVTAIYSGLDGTVYFIPRRNIFYVQHDKLGSSTLTYYGPFEGNPVQVLNLQPDVQAEIENHLFSVYGTVTDQSGRPIAGVQLTADCGHEKLERTGRAVTDENGRYTLGFTSSVKVLHVDPYDVGIQTARIEARAQGFYEASLCRQGNLAMAGKPPGPNEQRFVADYAGVVLPHKPYELNFVMHPAARIEGKFVDERGRSILRRPVWLRGDGLLKNTYLSGLSYGNGTFTIDHVPCGTVWFTTINGQLVQSGAVNLATPGTYRVQLQFGKSPSGRPTLRIAEFQAPEPSLAGSARPRVIDPNGNPVASAQVALCTRDKGVVIRAGKLSPNRIGGRTTTILETDADGSFDFSDRPDDFHLIVAHEKGLAWITREQFTSSPEIRLQSWGRIEGHLYIGRESGADKKMSLLNYINKNAIDQGVRYEYETETDAGGKFVFDKVPPGWLEIGYLTRMGNSSWSQTGRTPVQINPGVTLRVAIGGRGRPVVAKFVPPPGYDKPVYFGEGLRALDTLRPERPKPENYDRMTKRERQQWYNQWSKTPEAGAYYDAMWHDPGRRHYVFHIKKDGSFRIEDVIAGRYKFAVWIEERLTGQGRPEEIAGYYGTIEVPEMPGGRSDEPLDLGNLELTMHNPLRVGDIAPLFEAKTLDGKDLRLIDYRGKFVLLSFWQPVFHPEKQQLQELYDTYGGNRQLEIIGLGGNDTLEEVKNYVEENAIPWPQVFTGEKFKSGIAKDYGIPGVPEIFLVGPDGRIIAKNLRGEKLKSVVSEALEVANVNKPDVRAEVERSDKSSESKSSKQAVEKLPEMRGRVYGVVVNSVTGEPIAGAYVGVGDFGDSGGSNYSRHRQQGLYAEAQTDEEGRFVLEGVAFRDDHPLVVTHPEFVRHDMKVAVQRGGPEPEIKVSLRPAAKINVTVVDSNSKLLEGFWLIRLEALDGRHFIPPGRDRHLSSFASSIWIELPKPKMKPDKKSLSGTTGFSFTELDNGEYSIDVIKFTITDNYTLPPAGMVRLPLDTSNITYYGGIANLKIEDGQTKEVAIKPANYQTSITIKMPDDPVKKPHIPPFVVISRNVGLLLWNDGKAHGPEDHRLGRLQKNALYYNMVVDGDVLTIKNLPPGSYSVFAGPVYFMNAVRMKVLSGREVTVEIPVIQLSEHAKVGLWTFDRKVKPEAGSYSVSDLCELISAKTGSNPRIIAEASIQNEKLKLSEREMSVWDLLETLYLEKGWKLKEGAKKTLVLYPAAKADVQVGVEKH